MTRGGWSNESAKKGRCNNCRWSYFRGERFCNYCGGWVKYPSHVPQKGEDRAQQGKTGPTLPVPSRQQPQTAAPNQTTQQPKGRTAWATPAGTPRAGQAVPTAQPPMGAGVADTQPGDLEKIYRFSATVLGEQHPEVVRAKEAWQAAAKDLLRRNPPTLEKQVHTAKEKIGRMQKKVARTKDLIRTREQELDEAKQAVQSAQEHLDQARKNEELANVDLSQAQVDYGALLSKLQAQPGGQSTTGSLLAMVGIQQGQDIPTEVQDAINQIQAMVQSIAVGIKERQRENDGLQDEPQPENPTAPPVPSTEEAQAGNPPEATPTADTAQMETDVGDSPAETEEPAAKNLKRDVRGTPTRGSCP